MAPETTACNECRHRRRKCIRTSPKRACHRCNRYNEVCSFSYETNTLSEDTKLVAKEIDDLNSITSQLEAELKNLKNGKPKQQSISPLISNNQWKMTIQNGGFCIETGICSINDMLNSLPIRYLSPLLSTKQSNQDLVVHLNIGKTMRLRRIATNILVKCSVPKYSTTLLPVPSSLSFDLGSIMDQLIDTYFECHNLYRPMVHKPTFMKHYTQLQSPLDSLIGLCICCVVCAYPCDHISYSYQELRCVGDYFAKLAKSKIMDQFDFPEKRLENIIAINLLGEYLYTMLNISENFNLASMGFQLCQDLKPWYDKECQKPGVPSVECMLFSRHYSTLFDYNRLSDAIFTKREKINHLEYLEWKYLPDEPQETVHVCKAFNMVYKLACHPVMAKIKLYRHFLSKEDVHSLKFSDIILVDDIISEHWRKAPLNIRICENWLDAEQFKAKIDQSSDLVTLCTVAYLFSYINDIYATLLTPSDGNLMLTVFQELVFKRCLHCSQLTIYAIHRLTKLGSISQCGYSLEVSQCLTYTLDVLCVLVSSSNFNIKKEAKAMFSECMNRMDDLKLMKNHKVDLLVSPLLMGAKSYDISKLNPSVYHNYSHPWYAAMFDICHHFEKLQLVADKSVLLSNLPSTLSY